MCLFINKMIMSSHIHRAQPLSRVQAHPCSYREYIGHLGAELIQTGTFFIFMLALF